MPMTLKPFRGVAKSLASEKLQLSLQVAIPLRNPSHVLQSEGDCAQGGKGGTGVGGGGVGGAGVGGPQWTICVAGGSFPATSSSGVVKFTGTPVLFAGHANVISLSEDPIQDTLSVWCPVPPLKAHDVIFTRTSEENAIAPPEVAEFPLKSDDVTVRVEPSAMLTAPPLPPGAEFLLKVHDFIVRWHALPTLIAPPPSKSSVAMLPSKVHNIIVISLQYVVTALPMLLSKVHDVIVADPHTDTAPLVFV
jgi:hypothetical protein